MSDRSSVGDGERRTESVGDAATRLVANLLVMVTFLVVATMVAGFFGRWHYLLDLGSHLRIQAVVALIVSGATLFVLRRRRWAVASMLISLGLIGSWWPFPQSSDPATHGNFRLLSMNVLTSNSEHERLIEYIIERDPDFIMLQETNSKWIESLDAALGESWMFRKSVPRSDNFGIALYSKIQWKSCDIVSYAKGQETPSLSVVFKTEDGRDLRLIGTHPPPPMTGSLWSSRNFVFASLASDVQTHGNEHTIVAGDLNCTPWSYWFKRLLRESGLRHSATGNEWNVTWIPGIPLSIFGLPIDHVLVGPGIRVFDQSVGPDLGSDHRPVVVDFE